MKEIITLQTNRCLLTPFKEDDAGWLLQLINAPDVLHFMEGMSLFAENIESARLFIRNMNQEYRKGNAFLWAIQHKGELIGFVAIYDFRTLPHLFYAVSAEKRCQGFATECVSTVTTYIHDFYNLPLTTTVEEDNFASKRVLIKCGYQYDMDRKLYVS